MEWLRKAAEQGHAEAQYSLGMCYRRGRGVDKDYAKSLEWLRKAVEQGHPRAQLELGQCYIYGLGVEIDYKIAEKWFRKAMWLCDDAKVELCHMGLKP